ncbi:hypothetical protein FNV43_RR12250 [Rhamnella rubrinervis]|uniref:Uncharacterized protein n=1 Tax=Rhamnella rubrinervis TaxID=2594499 RepID=A0A8K0H7E5_9ROSA|nr:hypothetical protein FNV43_RR12250 [Rhamnella rubrinervis]
MASKEAREAVEQQRWRSCTLGLIYNATGNTITHVRSQAMNKLENGQWGVFYMSVALQEVDPLGPSYRGKDKTGTDYDRMLAWYNPLSQTPNAVYTEIREPRHYERTSEES